MSEPQTIAIPHGMTCKVDAPRIRVRKGKRFSGQFSLFGKGRRVHVINDHLVVVTPNVPKEGMLALLYRDQDAFFRATIKQVFKEIPA